MESQEDLEDKDQEDEALVEILGDLERRLKSRVPIVLRRSPETLFEELEALELVIDLRKKFEK